MPPPQTIEANSKGSKYAEDDSNKSSGQHKYYASRPLTIVTTFSDLDLEVSITRFSSSGSVDSTKRSPRSVTFRNEKRVPKSINATSRDEKRIPRSIYAISLTKSCSTLSREEESWYPGAGAISTNREDHSHTMASLSARNESIFLMTRYGLSPNPVKSTFCYGKQHAIQATNLEEGKLATSSMFTNDDIDSITPLQITTYLTMKQREKIAIKVLYSKLKKGFSLTNGKDVCATCSMPRLSKSSKMVEKCAICPVLKKRVLKKILNGC
eukprot:CAMPEP_0201865618 /NCGR_PEP_ID=MMETSP0902-20130614/443_1 /ASSEMBLY_ACC=CAM_ASM_000551 /TAXON_ID=420261 /ORGANISM="Thalassiosira antarctica, Strain CCMP982" /LENGTH=267 /DNA_ID=CAMNT_0048390409 /DNA_START=126 /DNA_END=929 /DNA_ORIENTATION=+